MTLRFSHFLLSAVAAALFVLCSLTSTAYASLDEYDFEDGEIRIEYESFYNGTSPGSDLTTGALNGVTQSYIVSDTYTSSSMHTFIDRFSFYNDVESLIAKDYAFNISFFGLFNVITSGNFTLPLEPASLTSGVFVYLGDAYGEIWECREADVTFVNGVNGTFHMDVSIPAVPEDVYKIIVQFSYGEPHFKEGVIYDTITHRVGFQGFGCNWSFQDPAAAAMPEILKQLKDLPKNIWAYFEGAFGTIIETLLELPVKIWALIEDGLKRLFIPSEEFIFEYIYAWDTFLYERLGALYQVFELPFAIYQVSLGAPAQPVIKFPTVTVPLGSDTEFVFGGWNVQIVPAGFEFLFDVLKTITSIVATLLFVNALRSRFERLLGGDNA